MLNELVSNFTNIEVSPCFTPPRNRPTGSRESREISVLQSVPLMIQITAYAFSKGEQSSSRHLVTAPLLQRWLDPGSFAWKKLPIGFFFCELSLRLGIRIRTQKWCGTKNSEVQGSHAYPTAALRSAVQAMHPQLVQRTRLRSTYSGRHFRLGKALSIFRMHQRRHRVGDNFPSTKRRESAIGRLSRRVEPILRYHRLWSHIFMSPISPLSRLAYTTTSASLPNFG